MSVFEWYLHLMERGRKEIIMVAVPKKELTYSRDFKKSKRINLRSGLDPDHKRLLALKEQKEELKHALDNVNKRIDRLEEKILIRLTREKLKWCWKYVVTRKNIQWKEEMKKYLGKETVELIQAKTKSEEYLHVGVEGFDERPKEKV